MKIFYMFMCSTIFFVTTSYATNNIFIKKGYSRSGTSYSVNLNNKQFNSKNIIAKNSFCWVNAPNQKSYKAPIIKKKNKISVNFKTQFEGYHDVYFYCDYGIIGRVKYHLFAQDCFRSFFMRRNKPRGKIKPIGNEISKKHNFIKANKPIFFFKLLDLTDKNNSKYRITGECLSVKVFFKNTPLKGAKVTLISGKGWQKTITTNDEGIVKFMIVKDSFENKPTTSMMGMPDSMQYKLIVEYEVILKDMHFDKEVYSTSTILNIYPSPHDWYNRRIGYYVFLLSAVILSVFFIVLKSRKGVR